MLNRFTTLDREKARVSLELAAAREMQRQLVPASPPELCDCRLEAAYFPAAEVGGDFYQVLPQRDGSSVLILGDVGQGTESSHDWCARHRFVSGAGLEELSPAQLLTRLNAESVSCGRRRVHYLSLRAILAGWPAGFGECGSLVTLSKRKEVPLESGLPLGIIAGLDLRRPSSDLNWAIRSLCLPTA